MKKYTRRHRFQVDKIASEVLDEILREEKRIFQTKLKIVHGFKVAFRRFEWKLKTFPKAPIEKLDH